MESRGKGGSIVADRSLAFRPVQSARALTAGVGMLVHIVVVDVLGNIREQLAADLIGGAVEDDDVPVSYYTSPSPRD